MEMKVTIYKISNDFHSQHMMKNHVPISRINSFNTLQCNQGSYATLQYIFLNVSAPRVSFSARVLVSDAGTVPWPL